MSISIFTNMIHGELQPWLYVVPENCGCTSLFMNKAAKEHPVKVVFSLLSDHPNLLAGFQKEMSNPPGSGERLVLPYIEARPARAYNRLTNYFSLLIDAASRLCLSHVVSDMEALSDSADPTRTLNMALNSLLKLLKDATLLHDSMEPSDGRWVMDRCRQALMVLILDLSLRYPELKEICRYDEYNLYIHILDRAAPEPPEFSPTIHFLQDKLYTLLGEKRVGEELTELWHEFSRMMTSGRDAEKARALRIHLENAALVILMEPAFLSAAPEKLRDAEFCRECVIDFRRSVSEVTDPVRREVRLSELATALETLENRIPRFTGDNARGWRSEARITCNEIFRPVAAPSSQPFNYNSQMPPAMASDDPGVYSLKEVMSGFIPVKDLMDYLGITINTLKVMLDRHKIKVSELSSTRRYIRKSDFVTLMDSYSKKQLKA